MGNSEHALSSVLAAADGLRAEAAGLWSAPCASRSAFAAASHDDCLQTEEQSFWFEHRNRCIVELVRRHPPAGPILDVGGGNGYVTFGLRAAGFDAIVLEPGAGGARNALQRGLAPVINATLESAQFRTGSLPAIGLFDVLEHLDDAERFLARASSLLQPAGRLYLTVPAYAFLWTSEDVAAGHVRRYTHGALREVLHASGFQVDYDSYFFVPLPAPILLFRKLPERLGIVRTGPVAASDHVVRWRPLRSLVSSGLAIEQHMIRRGRRMPVGASILVAARARQAA